MPVRGDPAHFPYTGIVDRTSGHLAVRVGRNRYGYVSIEDMAEQFPGLTFQGSGSADVDYRLLRHQGIKKGASCSGVS